MKRHVAILTAGALALSAGFVVTVKTADEASAAMRFNSQRFSSPRPSFQKHNFAKPNIGKQRFTPKKFNVGKQKFPKQHFTKPTKFGKIPKGPIGPKNFIPKGPIGPKGLTAFPKGPIGPKGLSLGPKMLKGPVANLGPMKLLPKGPKLTVINNKNFTIWRGPRGIWWNGRMRNLVALSVLGGLTVGSVYYLADGYVPIAAPVCRGVTAEGCQLVWRDVPTEDGDVIAQCVQFCPPPPPAVSTEAPPVATPAPTAATAVPAQTADTRAATAPVPPAAMAQGCDLSIHADLNFTGVNSEVTTDQPDLTPSGWDRSISSISIKSGTWDFYTEANYGGQMIRLAPGQYPKLADGWDKTINSLMCSQP